MDHDHGNHCLNPHWKAVLSVVRDWFRIPVRALNIVWGNDSRYWQWIRLKEEETRKIGFEEAAVLQQVNWLEVTGTIDMKPFRKAGTTQTYVIYYIVKFGADAFGWHSAPIKFRVRVNGEETEGPSLKLEPFRVKHDEWHEVPGGEFTVSTSSNTDGGRVEFGMFEVDTDWWKGSMVLAGIKIKLKSS